MFTKKVIISMSGGVDSAISAYLLQKQGYYVEAVFMKNWEEDDRTKYCNVKKDLDDAKKICNFLNIKLHTINFATEYWNNVFIPFLNEYRYGLTPNPDVLCNKEIKFKTFLNFAINDLEADFIATGHYVRCKNSNKSIKLLRGVDNSKDQSYFLYTLSHKQLEHCIFPLGNITKVKVRKIASKLGLPVANKKDSTGICFIGKRKFRDFIGKYLSSKPGKIISVFGQVIGFHKGLIYYTLGQRRGLGIGGISDSTKKDPWYVVNKNMNLNQLIVAQGKYNNWLMSTSLIVNKLHWVNRRMLKSNLYCTVKTHYQQDDTECLIIPKSESTIKVIFNSPVRAATPGQSAVFYVNENCLGGGIIKSINTIHHYQI